MDGTTHVLRLRPGQDLKEEIQQFVQRENIEAASVIMGIGSLTQACVRLARDKNGTLFNTSFEILTLMGTASKNGGVHLHISLSDEFGKVLGGHLMDGSLIWTTAEISILAHQNKRFMREFDLTTGFNELVILTSKG